MNPFSFLKHREKNHMPPKKILRPKRKGSRRASYEQRRRLATLLRRRRHEFNGSTTLEAITKQMSAELEFEFSPSTVRQVANVEGIKISYRGKHRNGAHHPLTSMSLMPAIIERLDTIARRQNMLLEAWGIKDE